MKEKIASGQARPTRYQVTSCRCHRQCRLRRICESGEPATGPAHETIAEI